MKRLVFIGHEAYGLCAVLLALMMMFVAGCGGSSDDSGDDDIGDDDGYDDDDDDDDGWDDDDDDGWYDDDDDDDYADDDCSDDDTGDDDTADDDTDPPELECPEESAPVTYYLSADDSNSQASPVVVRAIIEAGAIVPRNRVRTYEFTNYYNINYTPPTFSKVRVEAQMTPHAEGLYEEEYVLQIGAQSHWVEYNDQRPINLVLSFDVSGSMSGKPISLLKETARVIASRLRAGDIVSVVNWDTEADVKLNGHAVDGPNDAQLLAVINAIEADGSTNMHDGLVTAYELAMDNYSAQRLNRVVLISDGGLNTGITDLNIISQYADDSESEGIYLVGVGVGDAASYYYDNVMDEITDAGKGAYVFVDSSDEAQRQFGAGFLRNMEVAALDVRVELTMPYYLLMLEYHGEEYSTDPSEVEPQHLGPNDAMIFHQFIVSCDPLLMNLDDVLTVRATYTDPFTYADGESVQEATFAQLLAAGHNQLLKGDAIVTYAEAIKEIADLVYTDADQALVVCQAAREKLEAAAETLNDEELEEIADLLADYEGTIGTF
ncbi:MAG TPA: VWA domain-containing protein [bacterium]|nr:VWA domain-containing protein [bacterium]